MTESMWDNIDENIEDISTDFNPLPGTYEFQLEDIVVKDDFGSESKMHGQTAFIFKFQIIDGQTSEIGKSFDDFLRLPDKNLQGDKAVKFASILKSHLLWYGVPESQIAHFNLLNEADRDSLIGLTGRGTLKKNGDFLNLSSFSVAEESGVSELGGLPSLPSDSPAPVLGSW